MGGEAFHPAILNRHQITANSPIFRAKLNPLSCRFKWRTAGVIHQRVIAEETHRAHIAAGGQSGGNRQRPAHQTFAGDGIHMGNLGGFQRRPPLQGGLRLILRIRRE